MLLCGDRVRGVLVAVLGYSAEMESRVTIQESYRAIPGSLSPARSKRLLG